MDARDRVTTMADNIPSGGSGSDAMDRERHAGWQMPELTAAARAGARASARKPLSASAPLLLLGLALHPGAAGVLEVHSMLLGVPIGRSDDAMLAARS